MKFSIIIPVYNAESTIVRTLESCMKQSYLPKEIIVIDDCSEDNTMDLLLRWKDDHSASINLIIVKLEKNSGPSIARNRAWDLASGEYICFLDADDWFLPHKLEETKGVIEDQDKLILFSHAFVVTSDEILDKSAMVRKVNTHNMLLKNIFATPTVVIKRDIEERFDETMHFTEDHDLFLRITEKYQNSYYFDKILTCINRPVNSEGGLSDNKWEMRKGEMYMYKKYCMRNHISFMYPLFYLYSLSKHLIKNMKKLI